MKSKNIVSVRLNEDSYNSLADLANNDNVTITEKCRDLIENGLFGSFDEQEPRIEYRDKEIIKEIPVEKIVEKIVKVPEIQYVQVPGPTQYIEKPKLNTHSCVGFKCSDSDNYHINVE